MSIEVGSAYVSIIPSAKGFQKNLEKELSPGLTAIGKTGGQKAGKSFVGGFGSTIKGAAGLAGVLGAGVLFGKAFDFVKEGITLSSDFNEAVTRNEVIFGKWAKNVNANLEDAAYTMGMSHEEALSLAGGLGDLYTQLGMNDKQAAKNSERMLQWAADLGSFKNMDTVEVVEMITAAYRGEYDSLQRVIPAINAARVEEEALRMTQKESAKDLTALDKQRAVDNIIMKDGAKARGDYAKTAEGAANAQKTFNAALDDLQRKAGDVFLPVVTEGLNWLNKEGLPAATRWMEENGPAIQDWFIDMGPKIRDGFGEIADAGTTVYEAFAPVGGVIMDAIEAFNEMPDFVKEGLALAGGGLLLNRKLRGRGGAVGGGGGALGGIAGMAAGVVPVFVVNGMPGMPGGVPGKGGGKGIPPIAPIPGGTPGKTSWWKRLIGKGPGRVPLGGAKLPWWGLLPAAGAYGNDMPLGNGDDLKKIETPFENLVKLQDAIEEDAGRNFVNFGESANFLDEQLARLAKRKPGKAIAQLRGYAEESGVAFEDLNELFPKTEKLLGDLDVKVGGSAKAGERLIDEILGQTKALAELDGMIDKMPKEVRTEFEANGITENTRKVMDMARQYELTPKQVETIFKASGTGITLKEVRALHNEYGLTPEKITTLIRQSGAEMSRREVRGYLDTLELTPKQKQTVMKALGFDDARSKANSVTDAANKIPAHKNTRVSVHGAETAIRTLSDIADAMARIHDKTATVTTYNRVVQAPGVQLAKAAGGYISGPGTATSDSIPAMLSNGEYVVRAAAVDRYGKDFLHKINAMRYADGGYVGPNRHGSFANARMGSNRTEFVITNWNTGEGYMRSISREEIDDDFDYRRRVGV